MIKLIKKSENNTGYWEVWEHNKTLIVHQGTVGDTGSYNQRSLSLFENPKKAMKKLAEEFIKQGYHELDDEDLTQFVIHYDGAGGDLSKALEKRHQIENYLNECLGWTGNGDCDGGEIGLKEGDINIFCYVVDVQHAATTILDELKKNNEIDGAVLAFSDQNEKYTTVYPERAVFTL